MNSNKNFLVLGTGNAQLDLIHYLKKLDKTTIHAVSSAPLGNERFLIDRYEQIDIGNKEEVLRYAEENNIDYIYSVGSDIAMPTVAWICEQLGLKTFIGYKTAVLCNNKHLLRKRFKHMYGSIPYENLSDNFQPKHVEFPAVVKPVDSQGQRGITVVNSAEEIPSAYSKAVLHSRKGKALIEKKIEGSEVSVHTYVKDGKIVLFLPSNRISWNEFDGGIIHKHILPADISSHARKNLLKLISLVIETLSIENGPVYFQIIIHKDEPFLIEVTPRLDGCHMWRQIKLSTGIDLLNITIRHLMNRPFEIPVDFTVKKSTLEFLCQAPNQPYRRQTVSENSCYHEFYYNDGDIVKPINGQFEKCGFQIFLDD